MWFVTAMNSFRKEKPLSFRDFSVYVKKKKKNSSKAHGSSEKQDMQVDRISLGSVPSLAACFHTSAWSRAVSCQCLSGEKSCQQALFSWLRVPTEVKSKAHQ